MRWLILISLLAVAPAAMIMRDKLKCPTRQLPGGRVRIRGKGRVAKYICLRSYQVLGDKYSTCVRGRWDTPVPTCIKAGCLPIDVPHGQVLETYRGAFVTIHCDPGYSLIGTHSLYCNGAVWNDTAPVCREIRVTAQKSCDFENEDLCGWTHDANHDFDWRRHNFATPSGHVGTGPSFDHTFGPGLNGHYMYLETSSPRLENDTARLFSPVFTAPTNPNSCFIFWYHMYGLTTGSLNVYLHIQDTLLLFSQSGDQGNQWKEAVVSLPHINSSFQSYTPGNSTFYLNGLDEEGIFQSGDIGEIVIEGVRGTGYEGDTAIDDVKLTEGEECFGATVSTTSLEETSQTLSEASCEDRCFNRSADPSQCECTSDCVSSNTCCPDFLQTCHTPSSDPVLPTFTDWNGTSSLPTTATTAISNSPTKFEVKQIKTSNFTMTVLSLPTTVSNVKVSTAKINSSQNAQFDQTTSSKLVYQPITTTITTKNSFVNMSEITLTTSTSSSTEISNQTIQKILGSPTNKSIVSTITSSTKLPTTFTKAPVTYPTVARFQTKIPITSQTLAQFQTKASVTPTKITQFLTKTTTTSSNIKTTTSSTIKPTTSSTLAQFQTTPFTKIGQTTRKPLSSTTLKQTPFEPTAQNNASKNGMFITQKPTVTPTTFRFQRKPYLAVTTRKPYSRTSSSVIKNRLVFPTPPPHVVFRTPKVNRNLSVTLPTSTSTTKFLKNTTLQNEVKSKNDVLHPIWNKDTMASLPPHIPGRRETIPLSKTTVSTTFTALQKSSQHPDNATTTSGIKWKSKYKPLNEQPVHAQFAKTSPPNHLIHIIVLACVVLLSAVLISVCVIRRQKINRRSIEDDELDIRFLACDEILDFTLARPSDDAQVCETRR